MELEGKVWKSGKHWLVEVPSLDVMTQGHTKEDALEMIRDAILLLVKGYFKSEISESFDILVNRYQRNIIGITATDSKILLSLSLRRQRKQSKSTVREASKRLGSKSPNAYGQYEQGKTKIPLEKYELLLQAANPRRHSLLRVV